METYHITDAEILELKQTMGFRVSGDVWTEFAKSRPDGCDSNELIDFVKSKADPPYAAENLDKYLEGILVLFVKFIRGVSTLN
ncbi:MAG: hypothetical protein RBQ77_03645 [Candidatus Methanomethylophilaceae archaeon]|jgi:hypothetical protein|nr:hypothetical protein [Candidatus Methanomethylophilaceae archaeon]NLF33532.1 hypothetical protein [Thermoplasmatales archaeon]